MKVGSDKALRADSRPRRASAKQTVETASQRLHDGPLTDEMLYGSPRKRLYR